MATVWHLTVTQTVRGEKGLRIPLPLAGYGRAGHALRCKLSGLPQIYDTWLLPPPLLHTRQTFIVLYFDTEILCVVSLRGPPAARRRAA